jgi:DNA-binding NarL/FixJ family response regulator
MRLVIADDHTMVREGLCRAMEQAGFDVVAQAADGEAAVALTEEHHPDVVLMDLSLPVLSGAAATKRIRRVAPDTSVLVLSMLSDETAVASALAAGAKGYMVKDCTTAELVDAVQRIGAGESVISPSVSLPQTPSAVESRVHRPGEQPLVTRREEEILRLMATGVSIPDAARQLYISVKTVKNHLSSIYQKLDCHDRAQAVLKAVRMGIITLD